MALQPVLKDARANSAFESAMMPLRTARQRAIAERKQYIVCCWSRSPSRRLLRRWACQPRRAFRSFRWDVGTAHFRRGAESQPSQLPN